MSIFAWILTLSLSSGQLVRLPVGQGAITLLDLVVIFSIIFNLNKINFKKIPFFVKAAFLFMGVAALSLLLSPLQLDLAQRTISFSYLLRFGSYIMFGWIFKDRLMEILKLSGLSLAVLGLLQFIIFPDLGSLKTLGWDPHYFRVVSTFLDPNFIGAFLVLTLILLRKSYAGFTIVYLALLLTFSRSSYLMFLASGVLLAFFKESKKLFIATVILFLILLLAFQIYVSLVAIPRNISREKSASSRLSAWEQGLKLWQKYPLLGVGFNAYRYGLKEMNLGDEQFLKSHGASGNDASLLHVAATTGAIGLFVYLYFIFSLFKSSYPKNPVLLSALGGLLIHSLFSNSLFYPPILAWIMLISLGFKKDSM